MFMNGFMTDIMTDMQMIREHASNYITEALFVNYGKARLGMDLSHVKSREIERYMRHNFTPNQIHEFMDYYQWSSNRTTIITDFSTGVCRVYPPDFEHFLQRP